MKIGIITFHWATNYGAILQAYALQSYLEIRGHEVFIINYRPKQYKKSLFKCFFTFRFWHYFSNLKEYYKEVSLEIFRKQYLNETLIYESLIELKKCPPEFEVYICGSDQIWNPYFTTKGEGKPTSAYFLDFGSDYVKRISHAVSFGCEHYPENAAIIAKKYIKNFNGISVREDTGLDIVTKLGVANAIKLPDPTLLLMRDEYRFTSSGHLNSQKKAFIYILRDEYCQVKNIKNQLEKYFFIDKPRKYYSPYSVEEWVQEIRDSSFVLTNSFHGMVFSLIFHVPFIIIPAIGASSGMNDRFVSLLSPLNLQHRILLNYNFDEFKTLIDEKFSWQVIDSQLKALRDKADEFYTEMLSH